MECPILGGCERWKCCDQQNTVSGICKYSKVFTLVKEINYLQIIYAKTLC